MRLSREFLQRLKLSQMPAYQLAWEVGLHPCLLSKFVIGYLKLSVEDKRLIKLGALLGLQPHEVFENNEAKK